MSWRGYSVAWSPQAEHELRRLRRDVADQIEASIDRLALTGRGDMRPLRGRPGEYRLRVRDWRAILEFDDASHRLIVLRVLPRRRAYAR